MIRYITGMYRWLFGVPAPSPTSSSPLPSAPAGGDPNSTVDLQSLVAMLNNLAYEPKKLNDTTYSITIERDAWKIVIDFNISTNGANVWMSVYVALLEQADQVPAASWLALLRENFNVAPTSFAISGNQVYIQRHLENRGLTGVRLRKEIEAFDAIVRRTGSLWAKKKLCAAG